MESLTPQAEVAPLKWEKSELEAETEGEHGENTVSVGSPTPPPPPQLDEDHVRTSATVHTTRPLKGAL